MSAPTRQVPYDKTRVKAELCRRSFEYFVREFWYDVPGAAPLKWNWHMTLLCREMQFLAERVFPTHFVKGLGWVTKEPEPRLHDLVINISPGTSKSTICSILFHPWTWTIFPQMRHLNASHAGELVLDLAYKARDVIRSEKYTACFPDIEMREDRDAVGLYRNTHGGDRMSCTVAGKSPMGFHAHALIVDDPLDPKKAASEVELANARSFMLDVIPSRLVDKAVSFTVLIMQRVHRHDPTHVMVEAASKEDTTPVRQLKLPGELYGGWHTSPSVEELRQDYVEAYQDQLMDPVRLTRAVLRGFEARMGPYSYASQYGQNPMPMGGGMFRDFMFSQTVLAAPYKAKRVRFWDRAAVIGGCYTAGVLLAKADDGDWYVEHVKHGQWEPDERNEVMRAVAMRDRARYGPKHEPEICIEAEGGSSGRDAWKSVARALNGFRVKEITVTGSKDARAEPWASQLAAKNVKLVADGTWDLAGYVEEHLLFRPEPGKRLGKYKDQVDASTGAYNRLVGGVGKLGMATYTFGKRKDGKLKIVVCTEDQLQSVLIDDHYTLLVNFKDPEIAPKEVMSSEPEMGDVSLRSGMDSTQPGVSSSRESSSVDVAGGDAQPPGHCLTKLRGTLVLEVHDLDPRDYQDKWQDPIQPWGKTPDQLIMTKEQGKKLWSFLLKKRDPAPDVWVFCCEDTSRSLSISYAVCDALRISRNSCVWQPGSSDNITEGKQPPNQHVYDVVKASRGMVI